LTQSLLDTAARFVPFFFWIVAVVVARLAINWLLKRHWRDDPDAQFRFQLIMLALTFAGLLVIIVALPFEDDDLHEQLLGLIGILLSAAIALSSTTFIGNIMAGIMLKIVRSARPGDFITVADLTGRITEMDLLHTEIQTEFRDLVTLPNLYMVTHPLQVVRSSGTIITAEVSLGYDISHDLAAEVLRNATANCGLTDGFVQIRELGDFSVTYRVAGLLENVKSLISARSSLRAAILDTLHGADIEIVSPNFMNTRAMQEDDVIIPAPSKKAPEPEQTQAEDVAFDLAEEAASVEKIRKAIEKVDSEIESLDSDKDDGADDRKSALELKKAQLAGEYKIAEEHRKAKEIDEK